MNTFLTLLTTFYICDTMAEDAPLDHATYLRCAAAYETPKIGFLTKEERDALGEFGFNGQDSANLLSDGRSLGTVGLYQPSQTESIRLET